jgi:hypothetical protein
MMLDYRVYQKNDATLRFTIKDEDNNPVDLNGATLTLYIQTTPAIETSGSIVNGTGGVVDFDVTYTQLDVPSGNYPFEVLLINADSKRYTVAKGEIPVLDSLLAVN